MAENIHRKKLWGGRETTEEVHWKHVLARRACQAPGSTGNGCGLPAAIWVRIFLPMSYLASHDPVGFAKGTYGPPVTHFDLNKVGEVHFRVAEHFSCKQCQRDLEILVAHRYPSFAIVEWDRGPGTDNPVVQVSRDG